MNANKAKNIIRELVGFERQYITVLGTEETIFGGLKSVYFGVKDFFYILTLNVDETFELSFADAPSQLVEDEPTDLKAETGDTDEANNA